MTKPGFRAPGVSERGPTRPGVFFDRRRFLGALVGTLGGAAIGCAQRIDPAMLEPPIPRPACLPAARNPDYPLPAVLRQDLTPRAVAASHNNFYELMPGRGGPAWKFASAFAVEPWQIEIGGECGKPVVLDLDDLFAFPHEERTYHFRCVERWAMNVPWSGFPLRALLERVEPTASARFVRFVSIERPEQLPGQQRADYYPWPYHEALRMDEALCDLTLVATGVYGEPLLKQHGAPVRIVVPWKYGYKSPKSIVRIELLAEQPQTFWQMQPSEYGFLSNVNPNIPHPRWSQTQSYWLDATDPFPTPLFNGYEAQVAHLYPDEPRAPQPPLRPGQVAR